MAEGECAVAVRVCVESSAKLIKHVPNPRPWKMLDRGTFAVLETSTCYPTEADGLTDLPDLFMFFFDSARLAHQLPL